MKKRFLVLTMIACLLGLTACGTEAEAPAIMTSEEAINVATSLVETLDYVVDGGMKEQYTSQFPDYAEVLNSALDSWEMASDELGNYVGAIPEQSSVTFEKGIKVSLVVQGDAIYKETKARTATVEVILDEKGDLSSAVTNVNYDMSELMAKAGMNTLLGMGTVFAVLILISIIISAFKLIGKVQDAKAKKAEASKAAAVDNTIAQIAEKEEAEAEVTDDLELIAVITAAIAASEGSTSTDGYVVKSIFRR